jgi:hypothetical protein
MQLTLFPVIPLRGAPRANFICFYLAKRKVLDARLRGHDGKEALGNVIPAKTGIQCRVNSFAICSGELTFPILLITLWPLASLLCQILQ